jgi:hypothetical protein
VVDDALTEALVAAFQHFGQLLRPQRLQLAVVDLDLGEGTGDRLEERSLHVGQAALGCDCGRDAPRDLGDFLGVVLVVAEMLIRRRPR